LFKLSKKKFIPRVEYENELDSSNTSLS